MLRECNNSPIMRIIVSTDRYSSTRKNFLDAINSPRIHLESEGVGLKLHW